MDFEYSVSNSSLPLAEWIRLTDEDPVLISVSQPRKQKKSLLQTTVLFGVRTTSKSGTHAVERSYKDFVAFRMILMKRFPGACIAALPATVKVNKKNDMFLEKRRHQLEFFMQAVAENPFFRSDEAWNDFVLNNKGRYDRSLAEGGAAIVTASGEGYNRWRQGLSESNVKNPQALVTAISNELDYIRMKLKALKKASILQVEKAAAYGNASLTLYKAFADLYVTERDGVQFVAGSAQISSGVSSADDDSRVLNSNGVKRMADVLLQVSDQQGQYAAVFMSDFYNSHALSTALVDPIQFELAVLDMWRCNIAEVNNKIRAKNHAEALVAALEDEIVVRQDKIQRSPGLKVKLKRTLDVMEGKTLVDAKAALEASKDTLILHERGLLALDLIRYRAARTIRMERIFQTLNRFHLRGLRELSKVFDGSGSDVRLGRDVQGRLVVARNDPQSLREHRVESEDSKSTDVSSTSQVTSTHALASAMAAEGVHVHQRGKTGKIANICRSMLGRGQTKPKILEDPNVLMAEVIGSDFLDVSSQMVTSVGTGGVKLMVTKNFTASKGDELDVTKYEILSAKRVGDGLWYATNSSGESGLVPSKVVLVGGIPPASHDKGDRKGSLLRGNSAMLPKPPPVNSVPKIPDAPPGLGGLGIATAQRSVTLTRNKDKKDSKKRDNSDNDSDSGSDLEDEDKDKKEKIKPNMMFNPMAVALAARNSARRASFSKNSTRRTRLRMSNAVKKKNRERVGSFSDSDNGLDEQKTAVQHQVAIEAKRKEKETKQHKRAEKESPQRAERGERKCADKAEKDQRQLVEKLAKEKEEKLTVEKEQRLSVEKFANEEQKPLEEKRKFEADKTRKKKPSKGRSTNITKLRGKGIETLQVGILKPDVDLLPDMMNSNRGFEKEPQPQTRDISNPAESLKKVTFCALPPSSPMEELRKKLSSMEKRN